MYIYIILIDLPISQTAEVNEGIGHRDENPASGALLGTREGESECVESDEDKK